jgi:hypothetical protein
VIKIRYADLPGGLHVRAETRGKDTIVCLLPGLTLEQRPGPSPTRTAPGPTPSPTPQSPVP